MRSRAFENLHLGTQEVRILHFHKTLEDYLQRGREGLGRSRTGRRDPE